MTESSKSAYVAAGAITIVYLFTRLVLSRRKLPLPPGPKGIPLLGNVFDLPPAGKPEWEHWHNYKEKYGPISSLDVFGQTFIIMNDAKVALDLLRDRAVNFSERPKTTFAGGMIGWDQGTGFLGYNETFRHHRKNLAKVLSSNVGLATLEQVQQEEAAHFLADLLETPEDLFDHIRKEAGSVILRYTYGYTPEPRGKDVLVDLAGKTMEDLAEASVAGAFLVDVFPAMKYLPEWLPGSGFKKRARQMRKQLVRTVEQPYEFVVQQMRQQKHKTSFVSQALDDIGGDETAVNIHKWSALSMYVGGADTTVSSIMTFFLAMSVYPEVQKRAQEEIDRVIGSDRLPVNADKPNLPYIEAVMKETHRWHPVAPLGVAHASKTEDDYSRYRIPAGAIMVPNIWGFTHDPAVYPDPMDFKPERFLPSEENDFTPAVDSRTFVFGFGRRICPGRLLADNAVFMTIAQTLAVFNISKPVENGKVVEPKVAFTPGLVSHAFPYKVNIVPRSESHKAQIERAQLQFPWGESDTEALNNIVV